MAALAAAGLVVACSRPQGEPPPGATAAATSPPATAIVGAASAVPADQEARRIFDQRCMMCHGSSGKGDGPSSGTLDPKPRDFTDHAWQKATADAEIQTAIVKGGPGVKKSPLMPPNPDLADEPDVVSALVTIVRGFGS